MNGVIAYCENKKCGTIFSVPNLIGGPGSANIEFKNTRLGPCPNCGSSGLVPDGVYEYFDKAISFVRGPKESVEKLLELKQLILGFKENPKSKDEIVKEVQKISPNYAQTIQKAPDIDIHKWIATILAILTAAILVQQTYFKGSDDEIKDKVIEQLLNQNKTLIEQTKPQPVNVNIKIGRNDKCHCGSGLKYKKCCINKK
ncbi:SEC-C metal-binding domain-containing protein [Marinirhabdus gelatinilytica]|uniref:SEC-C motif-containing protein n=1 Tax=Marinirhabdus gelatinilytica TaxID=1703343 RepID=A0A370Q382_9FLAO|nr:SEC-C metal-binding domain-containing protein [Marinirhabdus gelatinilytica]RDK82540.1 SEC-C motif-containing protein [Marinirhabdus gelatinilytica]